MKLARGMWKPIFEGEWFGHQIQVLQNPEKTVATLIRDAKGAMVFLDHYFVCSGQLDRLAEKLEANVQVLHKNLGSFTASYMIVSAGPEYFGTGELEDGFEALLEKLDTAVEEFNSTAHQFGVDSTDLKHAPDEYSLHALSEPSLLITAVKRGKAAPLERPREVSAIVLGKTGAGETVEEKITDMFTCVVYGKFRKLAVHVLLENAVLSKLTAVVLDDSGDFQNVAEPNKHFDHGIFPDLQPVGMSLKTPAVWVNLNALDAKTLREMLDINVNDEKPFHGQEALKLLAQALDEKIGEKKGKLNCAEDLTNAVKSLGGDEFQKYRAVRWLRAFEDRFPNIFGGELDAKAIASPVIGSGSVALVSATMPKQLKRALALSILKSLSKQLEGNESKAMFIHLNAGQLFEGKTRLGEEIAEQIYKLGQKGVGYVLGAERQSELSPSVVSGAEASIEVINDREVAVKKKRAKPYRLTLRPPLSS
ncbi:hypothetical protein HY546_03735 [archaeon]|nr:hypothetical protein [archaeon]